MNSGLTPHKIPLQLKDQVNPSPPKDSGYSAEN